MIIEKEFLNYDRDLEKMREENEENIVNKKDYRQINEYLVDIKNNNVIDLRIYTLEKAHQMLESLISSYNCINCQHLFNCEACIGCIDCYECRNCYNCSSCTNSSILFDSASFYESKYNSTTQEELTKYNY